MAHEYTGVIDMEAILGNACILTNWYTRRSWPAIVRFLRNIRIDNDYIEKHKDYFVEILQHYAIHYAIGGNIDNSAGLGSPVCQSPAHHPEQLPWAVPDADGIPKIMNPEDEDHFESDSSRGSCNRTALHEPHIRAGHVETNTPFPYTRPDLLKPRAVKLYSYKRNSYIPAISVEGLTHINYVRRDIAEAAGVEIVEFDGMINYKPGQDDFCPPEGRATITWQSEEWITTIDSEFIVTSDTRAPDLMIGHELHAKAEHLRGIYWSWKALKHHYLYEAGLVDAPNPQHSRHVLHSPTGISRRREPLEISRYHRDLGPQSLNIDRRRSPFQDSSLVARPLSVKSEPIKFPNSGPSPLEICNNGDRTTEERMPFSQTPIFSDPGHRSRNWNRNRISANLDQVTQLVDYVGDSYRLRPASFL